MQCGIAITLIMCFGLFHVQCSFKTATWQTEVDRGSRGAGNPDPPPWRRHYATRHDTTPQWAVNANEPIDFSERIHSPIQHSQLIKHIS